LNPRLINYNFTTSLNLTKTPQQINTQYILTRAKRKVSIEKWGMDLKPPEMNVAFDVNGSELSIITKDEYSKTYKRSRAFGINFIYHYRMPKLIEIFFLLKEKIKNKLFSK